MDDRKHCDRIKVLYKRISRDLDKRISSKKCNEYINDFDSIKEDIYESENDWIEDYEDIYEVSEEGFFSEGASDDEIVSVLKEILNQSERILSRFGVDIYEDRKNHPHTQPINIHFSPNMTQNVNSSANAQASAEIKQEVDRLVREFQEESKRIVPNRSKLKSIVETLKTLGPYAAPYVIKFTDWLGKMW